MTSWGNIKRQCVHLGFEKDSASDKYRDMFIGAANRAILLIAATVKPIHGRYLLTHEAAAQNPARETVCYDIGALTREGENPPRNVFLEFAPGAPLWGETGTQPWKRVWDYRSQDSMLWLPANAPGDYAVSYHRIPRAVTADTPDGEALELGDEAAALVPLLAAHYLWLDDDERKAVLYWNEYDDLKNQLIQKRTPDYYPAVFRNTTGWY